jgi:hypothetical protein
MTPHSNGMSARQLEDQPSVTLQDRMHAKYIDTRSGRLRLAMIADNSARRSRPS